MEKAFVVKGSGIQKSMLTVPPTPFDFEKNILAGGPLEPSVLNALARLYLVDMFPEKPQNNLFSWSNVRPHELITFVSVYHSLNQTMNAGAIKKNQPILPITDQKVKERVQRIGMMSPLEIETRYNKEALKPTFG